MGGDTGGFTSSHLAKEGIAREGSTDEVQLSREDLEKILPHRDLALFIGSASVNTVKKTGRGILSAEIATPAFRGHFPGEPVMPGHWLVEFVSLTCAVTFTVTTGIQLDRSSGVRLISLDKCRFLMAARPGDVLICEAVMHRHNRRLASFSAMIRNEQGGIVAIIERLIGAIV